MMTVFHRDGEVIRHFWSSELLYAPAAPGQEPRHVGTLEPLWNLLDLTPEGRPPSGTSSSVTPERRGDPSTSALASATHGRQAPEVAL